MERVCVFIDGSNLYFALKRNNRVTRVDYHQFSRALVGDRQLVRTYYYNVAYDKNLFPEKAKAQMSFLDSLDRTPYLELRLGRLVPTADGSAKEKGVDVLMAADLVYFAARNAYDTAVVVTEDGDFSAPLELVKDLGKHVEVAMFPDVQTRELLHVADARIPMEAVLDRNASKIFPPEQGESATGRLGMVHKAFSK